MEFQLPLARVTAAVALLVALAGGRAPAQQPTADYRAALAAGTRSESGAPGPAYWQQRVSYRIRAELDPATAEIRGSERIVYHNRAPHALPSLVLNLYQNVFAPGVPRNRYVPVTGGVMLSRVAVGGEPLAEHPVSRIRVTGEPAATAPVGYAVQGTLARLRLPHPLAPGDSLVLEIDWSHRVPPAPSFRTGWEDALGGRAFQVAQWYPQIAVYDDVDGWDATPYLGDGEFYLEYGDFDVALTLPAGWIVGATGTLLNPEEVLTPTTLERLAGAARSDTTVRVVSGSDLSLSPATLAGANGKLTWRFRAENVRDFAFATSDRYVWDATLALVPAEGGGTRPIVVHALYRSGAPHWTNAARYGRHAIELLSRRLPSVLVGEMVIAEGPIGGMEYPGLAFIGRPGTEESLYGVIAHEVAVHQWFPMLVGQNEAAYAWMDEGLTTYYEAVAYDDYFRTDDGHAADLAAYLAVAGAETEVPLSRHTDLVTPYGARTVAAYSKPGILMRSLRSVVGEETFDRAMRVYVAEWMRRHPTPWDFYATFEREAGRDLDWFFTPWWTGTGVLDHAIESVAPADGGVRVTVADRGEIRMPARVMATLPDGRSVRAEIPVESWLSGARTATVLLPTRGLPVRVELDPERAFPDVERGNDVWTGRD